MLHWWWRNEELSDFRPQPVVHDLGERRCRGEITLFSSLKLNVFIPAYQQISSAGRQLVEPESSVSH
jgi:hypothetical protein